MHGRKKRIDVGAKLHPLTIEQNAITSFKSEPRWFRAMPIQSGRDYSCKQIGALAVPTEVLVAACAGKG